MSIRKIENIRKLATSKLLSYTTTCRTVARINGSQD